MRRLGFLLLLPLLAACAGGDDFARPGTWRAGGVNDGNLRLMLADPQDEVRGQGTAAERGQPGSHAVTRLLRDRRRPLLDSRAARVGSVAPAVAPVDAP